MESESNKQIKGVQLTNSVTGDIEPAAIQVAIIGNLHTQILYSYEQMSAIVQGFVGDESGEASQAVNMQLSAELDILTKKVAEKAIELNVNIYQDAPNDYTSGQTIHSNISPQVTDNLNAVLNEVAKDLCDQVTIPRLVTIYNQTDYLSEPYESTIECLIEITLCGVSYVAAMFNDNFYRSYKHLPNNYQNHVLIGYKGDASSDSDYNYHQAQEEATPSPIMFALEMLAFYEAGKCIDRIIYNNATFDRNLVAVSEKMASLTNTPEEACLLAAAKMKRLVATNNLGAGNYYVYLNRYFYGQTDVFEEVVQLLSQDSGSDYMGDYDFAVAVGRKY